MIERIQHDEQGVGEKDPGQHNNAMTGMLPIPFGITGNEKANGTPSQQVAFEKAKQKLGIVDPEKPNPKVRALQYGDQDYGNDQ